MTSAMLRAQPEQGKIMGISIQAANNLGWMRRVFDVLDYGRT